MTTDTALRTADSKAPDMDGSPWHVLRAERDLRLLLAAGFISGVGDQVYTVAVLATVFTLTGSGLAASATLVLHMLPALVFGPLAGTAADRLPRLRVMVGCDLARAVLALSLLGATVPGHVWVLYAGVVGLVSFSAFYTPARMAVVPSLVAPERLTAANALTGSTMGAVMVLGAALGGVVTGAFGPQVAFVLDALSFLGSALLTLRIRSSAAQGRAAEPVRETSSVASAVRLWPTLRGSRQLRALVLLALLWPIGGGILNVLMSVYAVQVFHAGGQGIGVLYAALGVGFIGSTWLVRPLARRLAAGAVLGFFVEGLCHMVVSRAPSLPVAAAFLAVATLGAGVGNAGFSTLLMRSVDSAMLGRVYALLGAGGNAVMAASMLAAGALDGPLPPRTLGLMAGALVAVTGLIGMVVLRGKGATSLPASAESGAG